MNEYKSNDFIWMKLLIHVPNRMMVSWGPFHYHSLTLIPERKSNYIHYIMWHEITYPFPYFNSCTIEVWDGISNLIPHFTEHVITYPCWDLS